MPWLLPDHASPLRAHPVPACKRVWVSKLPLQMTVSVVVAGGGDRGAAWVLSSHLGHLV